MITVLHIIDTGGPGGAESVFLDTASKLDRTRFRSLCLISRDGWLADSLRSRGLNPLIVPARGSFNATYLRHLINVTNNERVDVIAAHLYGSSIYGSLTGLLTHTPVVSVLHGQSDISGDGRFSFLKKFVVRHGSGSVVFVSEKLKMELGPLLGISTKKCIVIPNGVDVSKFALVEDDSIRHQLHLKTGDILIGAVGNIRQPKAYEVLLHAMHHLRNISPKYHLVIAGEGSNSLYDNLLKLRHELRLDEAVTFLGLRSDVAHVLKNLDVFALSSDTEGFSIACVEAMASRLPIVATRSGGPEEILEHERSGLLVPTQDPVSLAAAIARLAENRDLAAKLAANALQRVHSCYTLRAMLNSYEQVFTDVVLRTQAA